MAADALKTSKVKVVDLALRYGYETPESFQKAFFRFHGASPSAVRTGKAAQRSLSPLHLRIRITGGTMLDYRIEQAPTLYVLGQERRFRYADAFQKIPAFWSEYYAAKPTVPGYIGLCLDEGGGQDFAYLIGCFAEADAPCPDGYVKRELPPTAWAQFRATGPLPAALQQLNRRVYGEWLPSQKEYALSAGMNLEVYTEGDTQADDYVCYLWLPVRPLADKG